LNRVTVTRILKELEEEEGVLERGHSSLIVRVDAIKRAGEAHLDESRPGREAGTAIIEPAKENEPALEELFPACPQTNSC